MTLFYGLLTAKGFFCLITQHQKCKTGLPGGLERVSLRCGVTGGPVRATHLACCVWPPKVTIKDAERGGRTATGSLVNNGC